MSFIVIGENVHTTRVIRRTDARVGSDDRGREAIAFKDETGATRWLPIPAAEQATMEYQEGRIKHVRTAVRLAMEEGSDAEVALAYLRAIAERQVEAGAAFLDVNVDEVSLKLADQPPRCGGWSALWGRRFPYRTRAAGDRARRVAPHRRRGRCPRGARQAPARGRRQARHRRAARPL